MKTLTELLSEKRAHAEQNPRLSAYDQLLKYKDDDNIYISMTWVNKIGINPRSQYQTPIGIYAYPLKQAWKDYRIDYNKSVAELPFVSNAPLIQVIRAVKPITELSQYSSLDYDKDMAKLRKLYAYQKPDTKSVNLAKVLQELEKLQKFLTQEYSDDIAIGVSKEILSKIDLYQLYSENDFANFLHTYIRKAIYVNTKQVDLRKAQLQQLDGDTQKIGLFGREIGWTIILYNEEKDVKDEDARTWDIEKIIDNGTKAAKSRSPATSFWNVTRILSKYEWNKNKGLVYVKTGVSRPVHWNKIFRMLGYHGFSDKLGKGIIHPSEPMQAVFLSTSALQQVDTVRNVDYSEVSSKTFKSLGDIPFLIDNLPAILFDLDLAVTQLKGMGYYVDGTQQLRKLLSRPSEVKKLFRTMKMNKKNVVMYYLMLLYLDAEELFQPTKHKMLIRYLTTGGDEAPLVFDNNSLIGLFQVLYEVYGNNAVSDVTRKLVLKVGTLRIADDRKINSPWKLLQIIAKEKPELLWKK